MDIRDIVSMEYASVTPDTPVSKLVGRFDDPAVDGIVVMTGNDYEGVVTRRQLATSHRSPDQKARSLAGHVPTVAPDEDVREVAALMVEGWSHLLPVVEGEDLVGVVAADDILSAVEPFLDAATVREAYTEAPETAHPDTTFGEALNVLREGGFTHLPVVENDAPVGILSLYDVTRLSARAIEQSQGGDAPGFDAHGGEGSHGGYRSHGGFGAREGELARILDLPVRDVMVSPVRTITAEATLDEVVAEMRDVEASSLVVVSAGGAVAGIVTKTDVLDALTWEAEGNRAVQVYGVDLLDDASYEDVVDLIEGFEDMDADMTILDAKVHLHEHDETLRGTPLILARIRLGTDRGLFVASGEGYGATHALDEARDVIERRLRDRKTRGRSKKHPDEAFWERRFGWLLEG